MEAWIPASNPGRRFSILTIQSKNTGKQGRFVFFAYSGIDAYGAYSRGFRFAAIRESFSCFDFTEENFDGVFDRLMRECAETAAGFRSTSPL